MASFGSLSRLRTWRGWFLSGNWTFLLHPNYPVTFCQQHISSAVCTCTAEVSHFYRPFTTCTNMRKREVDHEESQTIVEVQMGRVWKADEVFWSTHVDSPDPVQRKFFPILPIFSSVPRHVEWTSLEYLATGPERSQIYSLVTEINIH